MVANVQIREIRLECLLDAKITTITVEEQAAIVAKLKRQGLAARWLVECPGECGGKTQWSLGLGAIGEEL
jgi:hypothetical protein